LKKVVKDLKSNLDRVEERHKITEEENKKYRKAQNQRIENLENRVATLQLALMKSATVSSTVNSEDEALENSTEQALDLEAYGLTKVRQFLFYFLFIAFSILERILESG